jgi:hypothetical protein
MTSVCAWCRRRIARRAAQRDGRPAITFGMCRRCLDERLAVLLRRAA